MAGTSIGRAALVFTSNTSQAEAGMNSLQGGVRGFAAKISSQFSSINVGSVVSGIKGPLLAAGVGLAGMAAGALTVREVTQSIRELSAAGLQAKSIGVATDQFMGLSAAVARVGIDSNQFGGMLGKLTAKIGAGGKDTAEALGSIGIRMNDLKGLSADRQFLTIADAMKQCSNTGTKSAAALKLFEDAGLGLLPVLNQGGDALDEFVDKQKAMGTALGEKDIAKIQEAKAAMDSVGGALEGLWNKVVVAAAPFVTVIADGAASLIGVLMPALEGAGSLAMDVFQVLATSGGYAWDVLKAGAGALVLALSMVVKGIGEISRALGLEFGASISKAADSMAAWGEAQISGFGKTGDEVDAWFNKLRNGTAEAVEAGLEAGVDVAAEQVATKITATANTAIIAGSADDVSARARFAESGSSDPALDVAKQTLQVQKDQLAATRALPGKIKPVTLETI